MKLLYIPSLNLSGCYWRIENFAESMVKYKDKVTVHVEYFREVLDISTMSWDLYCEGYGDTSDHIHKVIKSAFKFFDVIVFQRINTKNGLALINKYKADFPDTKILVEIDDSVGEVTPSSPYSWGNAHAISAQQLIMSDGVICSTQYLADSIRFMVQDKPIHIASNCINRKTWRPKKTEREDKGFRIGFVGGGGHEEDLHLFYRGLHAGFLEKNPDVKVVIRSGGWRPEFLKEHPQIDFKTVAWHIKDYAQELEKLHLDVAVAPLRDCEFNRCRSDLKWVEWSSFGVPLLASNVEPFKRVNGEIWRTSNDKKDWSQSLCDMVSRVKNKEVSPKSLKKQCVRYRNINSEARKVLSFLEDLLQSK